MVRAEPLTIRPGLELPARELRYEFARSGGPGGQNVNKVETKVLLRFAALTSPTLSEGARSALRRKLGSRLTSAGEILIHADRYRERERNVVDARERLAELLRAALEEPTVRRPSRPTRGSKQRRRATKQRRSAIKRGRRGAHDD
jgi:ribosome-associated protein